MTTTWLDADTSWETCSLTPQPTVRFTRMSDGTPEDFRLIAENDQATALDLPGRILDHLRLLKDDDGAYKIDRLDHVLQVASRAQRDGAGDDWIAASLVHDFGDTLAPFTHGEVAAEILRPFVAENVTWVVRHHGIFQRYYNSSLSQEAREARQQFREHPFYEDAVEFCEAWDQCSFDPDYDTLPLEHFESVIRRVFSRTPFMSTPIEPLPSRRQRTAE